MTSFCEYESKISFINSAFKTRIAFSLDAVESLSEEAGLSVVKFHHYAGCVVPTQVPLGLSNGGGQRVTRTGPSLQAAQ